MWMIDIDIACADVRRPPFRVQIPTGNKPSRGHMNSANTGSCTVSPLRPSSHGAWCCRTLPLSLTCLVCAPVRERDNTRPYIVGIRRSPHRITQTGCETLTLEAAFTSSYRSRSRADAPRLSFYYHDGAAVGSLRLGGFCFPRFLHTIARECQEPSVIDALGFRSPEADEGSRRCRCPASGPPSTSLRCSLSPPYQLP